MYCQFQQVWQKTCILPMPASFVLVVYANMNQGLFLNIAATKKYAVLNSP